MRASIRRLVAAAACGLALTLAANAQTPAPAPAATPQAQTPAPGPSNAPAASQTPAQKPAPGAPIAGPASEGEVKTLDIAPRPAVKVAGYAKWDDGYKAIMASIAKARAAVVKGNLKEAGRPMAAFVDTDDNGFKFEAMIAIDAAPAGAVDLGADAKIGQTPGGKAIKFQHLGAYDDVDATYEAITAYLDEKGYDAQNVFVEEYMNDPKGPDDTGLALDIYVFVK